MTNPIVHQATEVVLAPQPAPLVRQTGDAMLDLIAAAAVDARVDPEKLSALLTLKERVDGKQAEIEFNASFARLQMRLPRVKKNGTIDLGRGKPIPFAKWEDVDATIRPMLAEEGFALSFTSTAAPTGVQMTCNLTHIKGHSKSSEMLLPADSGPGRNNLQAIGSSRSYGKRYLACDILNIVVTDQDDDGRATGFVTDEQVMQLETLVADCGMSKDKSALKRFLDFANADSVRTIQQQDFKRCVEALRAKVRQVQR